MLNNLVDALEKLKNQAQEEDNNSKIQAKKPKEKSSNKKIAK